MLEGNQHLRRQLGFIERSCRDYDAGCREEALRIALPLRVLFHKTAHSSSLIDELNLRNSIQLLSTFREPYQGAGVMAIYVGAILSHDGVAAALDDATDENFVSVTEWWGQVVHVFGHTYSRKDIVLLAANQDGGAHVDPKPSDKLQSLRVGVGRLTTAAATGETFVGELRDSHFAILRQLGYEVLHSPDVIEAARLPAIGQNPPN